ncbi:IclR family transcriptional regulator C-terminal domain-containing protein [Pigmentiphaga sp. D-2]|uniref:IclR family transcriptional regulator domain-containing protein n=1 Tax=Pigmentiphaga sp. D-2 TaxID=1002116 RepID=UPI001052A491|nr:IclR family transcriptional regulator C-terminal domain-containing protein [Pigmentiphaga sp. D-2]
MSVKPELPRPLPLATRTGVSFDFPKSEYVLSLERGLAVIRAFNERHPSRTLSEVAQAVGLTRAAARRFLLTLGALGYVESDGKYYWLRPQTLELGYAYLASVPWWRYGQRVADSVAQETGCACAIGVLDRDSVAYLAYAFGNSTQSLVRSVGTRLPAYCTAIGRVLLGALPEEELDAYLASVPLERLTPHTVVDPQELKSAVRQAVADGYAIVAHQLEPGLYSIAMPVRDRQGAMCAALSLSLRDAPGKGAALARDYLPALKRAAADIASALPA